MVDSSGGWEYRLSASRPCGGRLMMELRSVVLKDLKILKGNKVSMGFFLSTVEGIQASFS